MKTETDPQTASATTAHTPRVVFLGTPAIAVPTLRALANSLLKPIAVITEPDKPVGRKKVLTAPEVKIAAKELRIPYYQPHNANELKSMLTMLEPTVGVIVAYGRIIKPDMLRIPLKGFLNLHFSLLPKYRGATPIQTAIANGETETGVSMMRIDEGLDTGPLLGYATMPIEANSTTETLGEQLAELAASMAITLIPGYLDGSIVEKPQDFTAEPVTRRLTKEDGKIDWSKSVEAIERFTRAMYPWPKAWTELAGERFIIHRVHVESAKIAIDQIQAAGGRIISGKEFASGYQNALTELMLTGKVIVHS